MTPAIRWKSSLSASCLHAATCRAAGLPCHDSQLGDALQTPADELIAAIVASGWPIDRVLETLTSLSSQIDNNRDLAQRTASRLGLPAEADHPSLSLLAGAIADLEAALRRQRPNIEEELTLRGGPLREQWEARGPGMLAEAMRLTDPSLAPAEIEVVLVAPYTGGFGWAHAAQNRVTLEAVLVNPRPELPETVRLAWLACQLNADVPPLDDVLPPPTRAFAMACAALPPALAGAAAVELVELNERLVASASAAWGLDAAAGNPVGPSLWSWWNAWLDGAAAWPVAVAALAQMLSR